MRIFAGGWLDGQDSNGCCGRPLISSGLLDQAVKQAQHNVESLYPWAAAGKPIMACEPKPHVPELFHDLDHHRGHGALAVGLVIGIGLGRDRPAVARQIGDDQAEAAH